MRAPYLIVALLAAAAARATESESAVLSPEQWPTTVTATVEDVVRRLPEADKARVRETKREDLIQYHFGWGMGIRNRYGLWRGNRELLVSACGRPCHPDDASMIIIEAVWKKLRE